MWCMYWSDFKHPRLWRRALRHLRQLCTRGWDDSDLWNLDDTMARWLLPRLRRYRERVPGWPGDLESPEQWHALLDDMIYGLEATILDCSMGKGWDQIDRERMMRGLALIGERFRNLWW